MSPAPTRREAGRRALVALAKAHHVQPGYTAQNGRRRRADADTLVAVLRTLGVPIDRPDQAADALAEHRQHERRRPLEPVLVRRPGTQAVYTLRTDGPVDPQSVWLTLTLEDGGGTRRRLDQLLAGPPRAGSDGLVHHHFRLDAGGALPVGYHRLRAEGPKAAGEAVVIAAPAHCPRPARTFGLSVALHALRGEDDWGVGSYRDLAELADWVADQGGGLVGTLPLLATFLEPPLSEPSPYRPASRVAWNELYVDPVALPEFGACPEARRLVAGAGFRRRLAALAAAAEADPAASYRARRQVLDLLARRCYEDRDRRRQLETWLAAHPHVATYARFRAVTETEGRPWQEWARRPGTLPRGAVEPDRVRTHCYAQWVADTQLAAAGRRAGLYLDLPVGVHPAGFDPWWQPGAFLDGASGGAPPDEFFAGGQDWGFHPLHPDGIRADGYRYLVAVLGHVLRRAGAVRIDHVMGLHRLYVIPDGMDATAGAYVQYRADELHAVVVLEAERAGAVVAGEDLGTVPGSVRRAMARDGILRSHVFQFESTASDPLPAAPADSLASTGTHDLPPFAAYFAGDDIDDRARRGLISADEARRAQAGRREWRRALASAAVGRPRLSEPAALSAVLRHLGAGSAAVVMADLEDLWGERQPQNRPGTTEGNFVRRATCTLAEARADRRVTGTIAALAEARTAGATAGTGGGAGGPKGGTAPPPPRQGGRP